MVLQLTPLDAFSPFQEKCAGHQPEIKIRFGCAAKTLQQQNALSL
jgi:hypothetical protein